MASVLVGRGTELARIDDLVGRVRAGRSAALVIRGDAGIGKSSLLEHAISRADGLAVVRARGAESEQNLPFAGLADLTRPLLGNLDALPGRQRDALAGALAIGPAVPADRFELCAATFGLMSAAAAVRPVLAVIDDMHWLDAASAQAVDFTARRLGDEGVGLLLATRPDSGRASGPDGALPEAASSFTGARLDTMSLGGLGPTESAELLTSAGRHVAAAVADQLATGCGGNPLALLEVSAALTGAQLAGEASLPEPLPVASALRAALSRRLAAVGPSAGKLLLLAAADAAADLGELQAAAAGLGIDVADLAAAEEAGLVRVAAGRVEFSHPLLRSAAYHAGTSAQRRAAHRALAHAIASGPGRDPVRRAWHLAASVHGPDETAAEGLDQAAAAAMARNAFVAASRASQRAAELTVDPAKAFGRWLAAGFAAYHGGDRDASLHSLNRAIELAPDPCSKADAELILGTATAWMTDPQAIYQRIVGQAEAVLPYDAARAASLLGTASLICLIDGRFAMAFDLAERSTALTDRPGTPAWLFGQTSLGCAKVLIGDRAAGLPILEQVTAYLGVGTLGPEASLLRFVCGYALSWCEEYQLSAALVNAGLADERAQGRVSNIAFGLGVAAQLHFRTGEWARAYAAATEGVELGRDFAAPHDQSFALVGAGRVEAGTGADEACRQHLDEALQLAEPLGIVHVLTQIAAVRGLLELGAGNYRQACAALAIAGSYVEGHGLREPCLVQWRPDYIEALAALGRYDEAAEQLALLDAEAAATGSQWAAAAAARCAGLLQPSNKAVETLRHAVNLADAGTGPFDQARARLALGRALRRARRRSEAARELEQANTLFEILGARQWAAQAITELTAVGGPRSAASKSVPKSVPLHTRLTSQELRVALQVAEGLSNKEVAARLFLSPKTVETHLGHVYDKLGIRSRAGLARVLSTT